VCLDVCCISFAGVDNKLIEYVLHTDHSKAVYEKDCTSGRHSVRVSVGPPQAGAEWVTVPYKFMCKSSCDGGMNRRLTEVIFTLENERYGKFLSLSHEVCPYFYSSPSTVFSYPLVLGLPMFNC
jgi:hypothetical protein